MVYLLSGVVSLSLFFLYRFLLLPYKKRPHRFRYVTEKQLEMALYVRGKWHQDIRLPWKETVWGEDPASPIPGGIVSHSQEQTKGTKPYEPILEEPFPEILLTPEGTYLRVTAKRPVLIQGLERTTGWLKPNGVLKTGPYKIVFKGAIEVKTRVRVPPTVGGWLGYYGPGWVTILLSIAFFATGLNSLHVSRPSGSIDSSSSHTLASVPLPRETSSTIKKVSPPRTQPSPAPGPQATPRDTSPESAGPLVPTPRVSSTAGAGVLASTPPPSSVGVASMTSKSPNPTEGNPFPPPPATAVKDFPPGLLMVYPGQLPPPTEVKALFVHAHPDDESIEFGTLLGLCKKAGIPTATVLFTDGEGGIFATDYPGPRTNLRETRVREAAWAIHTLGSVLYVRLGLSNLPYNGTRDEQKPAQVIQRWGGAKAVFRMKEILLALKPEIVVSPEEPSAIRKHFEHEATALVVSQAIEALRKEGKTFVKGYLQSLDPRDTRYAKSVKNKVGFPRKEVASLQREALSFHRTQADAHHYGILRVEKYPEEEYVVKFWDLPQPPSQYFERIAP